jgi:hypothetical protein
VATGATLNEVEAVARRARAQARVRCQRHATRGHLAWLLAYLVVLLAFVLYSLLSFWPRPTPSEQTVPRDTTARTAAVGASLTTARLGACDAPNVAALVSAITSDSVRAQMIGVCYVGRPMVIWKETQLVLLVLLAGALGALLSCLRSATLHFYKGDLCAEGLPGLYTWPLSGAVMGLVFYTFIRGGFFSGQSTVAQTSTYSFVASAMLVGMFMHEAIAKVRQIAETLLTRVDSKPTDPPGAQQAGTTETPRPATVKPPPSGGGQGERGDMPSMPTPVPPPATVG